MARLADIATYVGGGGAISAAEAIVAPPREPRSPLLPPGPVIGLVWSALFASLGVARSKLHDRPVERRMVDALWLLCVGYPLYTKGFRSRTGIYAGNAVVGATATGVALQVQRVRPGAAAWIWPVVPWVAYATLGALTERRR